jgi:hypothetical protein
VIINMLREVKGNIWNFDGVKIITTNGMVNKYGSAVMGKGLASQAKIRYPELPELIGIVLRVHGNHVHYFEKIGIIMFPTKERWWEKSKIDLIERSMEELVRLCRERGIKRVVIPHFGCENGGLVWRDVKGAIRDLLHVEDIEFIAVRFMW